MSDPDRPSSDTTPNADSPPTGPEDAPPLVSTERRRFFREILFLGVQGAEHLARDVGKTLGDALESTQPTEPDDEPPPPAFDPPDGAEPR